MPQKTIIPTEQVMDDSGLNISQETKEVADEEVEDQPKSSKEHGSTLGFKELVPSDVTISLSFPSSIKHNKRRTSCIKTISLMHLMIQQKP